MIKNNNIIALRIDNSEGPTYYDKQEKKFVKTPNDNTQLRVGGTSTYVNKETKEIGFIILDIYVESIKYAIKNKKAAYFDDGSFVDVSKYTVIEVIGGVGVHEGTHSTDSESNSGIARDKSPTNLEKLPKENERKYYEEIDKKKEK